MPKECRWHCFVWVVERLVYSVAEDRVVAHLASECQHCYVTSKRWTEDEALGRAQAQASAASHATRCQHRRNKRARPGYTEPNAEGFSYKMPPAASQDLTLFD